MTVSRRYGVFVVRIWHEPTDAGEEVWRASAMNTVTKERSYFATEQELVLFLGLSDADKEGVLHERTLEA